MNTIHFLITPVRISHKFHNQADVKPTVSLYVIDITLKHICTSCNYIFIPYVWLAPHMLFVNKFKWIIKSSVLAIKNIVHNAIYIALVTFYFLRCIYKFDCYQNILIFFYLFSCICADLERSSMGKGQSNSFVCWGRGDSLMLILSYLIDWIFRPPTPSLN